MCIYAAPPLVGALEPAAIVWSAGDASVCARSRLHLTRRRLNVLAGERARVRGFLAEGDRRAQPGISVVLQALEHGAWRAIAHTSTRAHGRFTLTYATRRTGSEALRVRFRGDASAAPAARAAGRLDVYRLAGASWYGGGGGLACGGELTSSTLGVANKTLPCGTLVTLRYGGRTVRVPVIDRGPYVEGREFDLTEATKRALGFGDTGDVWFLG
jgi:rare lipoprotein A